MFDIGGWEFLLIAILGIIIIGPKELPGAIRTVSMFVRRARELARDFQSGMEEVAREAELDKLKDDVIEGVGPDGMTGNLRKELEDAVDPEGNIRESIDFDSDWTDDDLIDYDDPEFADDNRIAGAEQEKAVKKTADEKLPDEEVTDEVPAERPAETAGPADEAGVPEQHSPKREGGAGA